MASILTLLFKSIGVTISEIDINKNDSILIGRDTSKVNICFDDFRVSSVHSKIEYINNQITIEDLGSKNGTYLNGQLIERKQIIKLNIGDEISFGGIGVSELIIKEKSFEPEEHNNKNISGLIIIGRSKECDIVISNDESVSRRHASIQKIEKGKYLVKDLNSTNGVYFNGERVKEVIINKDDFFIVGKNSVNVEGKINSLFEQVSINVEGVSKKFSENTISLHPLSFQIKSKTITAILGPTGCGKSTLLKLLNREISNSSGSISIFGLDLNTHFSYLKKQIGYVPQDDIIHLELTVWQSLYYAAKLRLENSSEKEIVERINDLLSVLKIDKIKNNLNSGISGGQRKRVCIAIELLSNPLLLLLDEPTSPLDPQSIKEFLSILIELKNEGTTIVMVTHKPEDLEFMDEVIFLAENGHLIYKGETSDYLSFFKVKNTIEVYSQLSGVNAKRWIDKAQNNSNQFISRKQSFENKSDKIYFFSQFKWLTIRNVRVKLNDRLNTAILILQAPIIALLIALIFKEISLGVLFMMCVSSVWFGVNNSAREIVKEKSIYRRERKFNLSINAYILSKLTTLVLIAFIQSLLFNLVLFIAYQNSEVSFNNYIDLSFWMIYVSTISSLLGLTISATMTTTEKVMSLVPILLIPQIMLAGVITKIQSWYIEYLSYFTFSRWGTEGISIIQRTISSEKVKMKMDNNLPKKDDNGEIVKDIIQSKDNALELLEKNYHNDYLSNFGNSSGTFELDFIVLLTFGIVIMISLFFIMKRKDFK